MAQYLRFSRYIFYTVEDLLRVSNTAYPDGTFVEYLLGMEKPVVIYSGYKVSKNMWLKKAGKNLMRIRQRGSRLIGTSQT